MANIRVVANKSRDDGLTLTQGTRVYAGDTELEGIHGVTLYCKANSVWTATIECNVILPELEQLVLDGVVVLDRNTLSIASTHPEVDGKV